MKLLIVGGGLQGLEVCYLARKSSHKSILIDRIPDPIALGLADEFHKFDIRKDKKRTKRLIEESDFVIPTTENIKTLKSLEKASEGNEKKILFDFNTFFQTSDKGKMYSILSDSVRIPSSRSRSSPPWIAKPVFGSGSEGIVKLDSEEDLKRFEEKTHEKDYIIQKFLEGMKYSTEAIAMGGELYIYETTTLDFDENFQCCRVICDPVPKDALNAQEISVKSIYDNFDNLEYLFDVQTIYNGEEMFLFEINARFPSQTPMAVYWSSDVNLLDQLLNPGNFELSDTGCVVLEHFVKKPHDNPKLCSEISLLKGKKFEINSDLEHGVEAIIGKAREGKGKIGTVIFAEKDLNMIRKERKSFYKNF
ncbi:hypothetical protein AKJ51_03655 [candidate division MSBL1 archaeon SCGC-AAA382A20]|uniref:ATP-grasp domain-containing protein n=1 Tax=candidate division MSBL1 archaeon SCGC-AAA382A20 TaxID=1698280 RepID=A0A133VJ82_9EURY|nr:hypothetical protein AKJ51_03655 [candidate division MSBL1 archaeon SCGC-AAA382A20]